MSDWPETKNRLEQLATSSIVGADIRAALAEIARLTAEVEACHRTLAMYDAQANKRFREGERP
jgi:hypothetical protein